MHLFYHEGTKFFCFLKSKGCGSLVPIVLLYIPIFLIRTVMLRNEASVPSLADALFFSMTKSSGLLQIKKDFHSHQVYLT
jgi:hypothetical protein